MSPITLRPAEPENDFARLAALFTLEQDEPTSEPALKQDYEDHKDRILRLMVAEDERGELLGFNWLTRSRSDETLANCYLIVRPERRGQGAGHNLYQDLEQAAGAAGIKQLRFSFRDNDPRSRAFADRHGFAERSHTIGMTLDLETFDERPYLGRLAALQAEGFQFTSMGALGNTEEAQRRLYALNDMTDLDTPGSNGEHAWSSFDDFQKRVCGSDWYRPDGQMLVIEAATGTWVALSAITRFAGVDYAYNLHTGVDRRYRGRKLAQSVKILALRYAREVLKVKTVNTHHSSQNEPMIAIDNKFGYLRTPGLFSMGKLLNPTESAG